MLLPFVISFPYKVTKQQTNPAAAAAGMRAQMAWSLHVQARACCRALQEHFAGKNHFAKIGIRETIRLSHHASSALLATS
eukprot:51340-Pelagomonas_calceolata.AAC.1